MKDIKDEKRKEGDAREEERREGKRRKLREEMIKMSQFFYKFPQFLKHPLSCLVSPKHRHQNFKGQYDMVQVNKTFGFHDQFYEKC